MADQSDNSPAAQSTDKPTRGIIAFVVALMVVAISGTLPVILGRIGYKFLPSAEFHQSNIVAGYCLAFIAAIFTSAILLIKINKSKSGNIVKFYKFRKPKEFFAFLILPAIIALMTNTAAVVSFPMAYSFFFGERISLNYTVEGFWEHGDLKCHSWVGLVGLPNMFDRVCGVPESLRKQLKPGTRIELEGYGTEYGLFYDTIRLAPSEANTRKGTGSTWTPDGFGVFTGPVLDLPGSGRR